MSNLQALSEPALWHQTLDKNYGPNQKLLVG